MSFLWFFMSNFLERLKELTKIENLTREDLAEKVGIRYTRISNLFNERGHVRIEEVEEIGNAFPEYKHWLVYGEELPEAGQISPATKKAQQDLNQTGVAG